MSGETLKDSGKRAEFDTGSVRDTEDNKGRFDLLPLGGLLAAARQFQAWGGKIWRGQLAQGPACRTLHQ